MNFRIDIQGLRTISIIGVLFYHYELIIFDNKIFKGGFLGVDIFFVISGYLITKIIYEEILDNNFSFKDFYEKRARRILPSLFLVIAITLIFSNFLLDWKAHLENINVSLASIFFNSNHFFSIQDSYNAEPSRFKPLLHTWSLSVEEQFYLIFPALIYFFFKRKFLIILTTLAIFSFIFSIYGSYKFPDVNFYILISRIWEFAFGAAIVFYQNKIKLSQKIQNILSNISIFVLILCFVLLDNSIKHPALVTFIPILATNFIICFGTFNRTKIYNFIFNNKINLFFGKISYTLYLVHFPIIVFTRIHQNVLGNSNYLKIALILICIFLSTLIYELYEKKFRKPNIISTSQFFKIIISYIIFFLTIFIWAHYKKYSLNYININNIKFNINDEKSKRWEYLTKQCIKIGWDECYKTQKNKINILVVGDSMAPDSANILNAIIDLKKYYIVTDTLGGCPPVKNIYLHVDSNFPNVFECHKKNKIRFEEKYYNDIKIVIINNNYNWLKASDLHDYLFFLKKINIKKIILVGNYIKLKKEFPEIIRNNKNIVFDNNFIDKFTENNFSNEKELNKISNKFNALFLSYKETFCVKNNCELFTYNNIPFTWDQNHIAKEFAENFAKNKNIKTKILNYISND